MELADKVDAMTIPEKIGEPSMEEILASIRKIIAEEPHGSGSAPDRRAVNPLLAGIDRRSESADAPLPFSDRPPPSLDRLSNALKPDPVPPREAIPARTSPLDDDLADLLDEPPGVLPPSPFGVKRSAPPAESSEAAPAEQSTERSPAPSSPALDEVPALLAPAVESTPAVVTPPVSAMPPLRRAAFYPPQRKSDPPAEARVTPPAATASELPDTDAGLAWKSSAAPSAVNGRAARLPATTSSSPLDTLAAGLAAAALSESAAPSPAPGTTAASLVPAPVETQSQAPVRSLEDAVTDLLKPMLQQWLADNMPRIIERALRVEAASGVNPGDKPPASR